MSTTSIIIIAVVAVLILITLFIVYKIATAPQLEEPYDFNLDELSEPEKEVLNKPSEEKATSEEIKVEKTAAVEKTGEVSSTCTAYANMVWQRWQAETGNCAMREEELVEAAQRLNFEEVYILLLNYESLNPKLYGMVVSDQNPHQRFNQMGSLIAMRIAVLNKRLQSLTEADRKEKKTNKNY